MKRKKFNLLTLSLLSAMVLGVVSCGGDNTSSNDATSESTSQTSETTSEGSTSESTSEGNTSETTSESTSEQTPSDSSEVLSDIVNKISNLSSLYESAYLGKTIYFTYGEKVVNLLESGADYPIGDLSLSNVENYARFNLIPASSETFYILDIDLNKYLVVDTTKQNGSSYFSDSIVDATLFTASFNEDESVILSSSERAYMFNITSSGNYRFGQYGTNKYAPTLYTLIDEEKDAKSNLDNIVSSVLSKYVPTSTSTFALENEDEFKVALKELKVLSNIVSLYSEVTSYDNLFMVEKVESAIQTYIETSYAGLEYTTIDSTNYEEAKGKLETVNNLVSFIEEVGYAPASYAGFNLIETLTNQIATYENTLSTYKLSVSGTGFTYSIAYGDQVITADNIEETDILNGSTVTLSLTLNDDYLLNSVSANGETLTAQEDGTYVLTISANTEFVVSTKQVSVSALDFRNKPYNIPSAGSDEVGSFTVGDITYSYTNVYCNNTGYAMFTKSKATFWNVTSLGKIEKIVITSTSGAFYVQFGNEEALSSYQTTGTSYLVGKNANLEIIPDGDYSYFNLSNNNKNNQIITITVYYSK